MRYGKSHSIFLKRPWSALHGALPLVLFFAALGLTGCTSNLMKAKTTIGGSSTSNATPIFANTFLTLSRVVPSASNKGALDLIGDGSGGIGIVCGVLDQAGNPAAPGQPSNCQCTFSFIDRNNNSREESEDSFYVEGDLLRCSRAKVPDNVPYVLVKISLKTFPGAGSNEIKITQIGSSLDTTDPATFVRAERYQCRDYPWIPHLLDSNMYDPLQADDTRISYPMNFYTTNFGAAFATYVQRNIVGWNCPSNPTTSDISAGIDLTLYSLKADALGSIRIFPPQGSANDRSTFYLAKAPTGIFNVAVNAFMAPAITTGGAEGPPPIGYGASPIPSGAGESCPDVGTQIPSGFHWVKVWLFRKSFDPRKRPTSKALLNMQAVTCNPGSWEGTVGGTNWVVNDCANLPAFYQTGTLAARWLTTATVPGGNQGVCVRMTDYPDFLATLAAHPGTFAPACQNPMLGPGCTSVDSSTQHSGYEAYPFGADIWEPKTPASCGLNSSIYPMNLCQASMDTYRHYVPYDTELGYTDLDASARYDFLFVVSPPTVMASTMQTTGTDDADTYTPYRYLPGDCNSPDPTNPQTPGDCEASKRVIYGLKLHDVNDNSDPAGNEASRTGVFPVCALQPN